MTRLSATILVALFTFAAITPAFADQAERPVPEYDGGREAPPTDAGDVLIWVPRVALYPAYLVTEYLVRWPVGTLVTWLEEELVLEKLGHVFSFGSGGQFGVVPTAFVEFNFRPSIGLYFWADDVPTENDALRMHFAWGGEDWWLFDFTERFRFADEEVGNRVFASNSLSVGFTFDKRPDHAFFGVGPQSSDVWQRFLWKRLGGEIESELLFGVGDGLRIGLTAYDNEFGPGDAEPEDDEISIEQSFGDDGALPGFDGYSATVASLALVLDSRPARPEPGSGVRFEVFGDYGQGLDDTDVQFARFGGELGFFVDLDGRNTTLGLRTFVALAETIGDVAIPFTELLSMGGADLLRGLPPGRYRGESAALVSLQYTYPVWVFLDGFLFVESGGVFGERFDQFDIDNAVASFGLGMRSNDDRDVGFAFLVGAGTAPFGQGFSVEEVRFQIGVSRGF